MERRDNLNEHNPGYDERVSCGRMSISREISRFFCSATTKASIEGTGMGLYNAKKMAEKHQGRIWAESEGEWAGGVQSELK